jgi:hypothetical protein
MQSKRPAFEHGTGFLLSRLGTLAERAWSTRLAEHALTPTQYVVLAVLDGHQALGQGQLAWLAGIDARNLVAVLDALRDRELVLRTVDRSTPSLASASGSRTLRTWQLSRPSASHLAPVMSASTKTSP